MKKIETNFFLSTEINFPLLFHDEFRKKSIKKDKNLDLEYLYFCVCFISINLSCNDNCWLMNLRNKPLTQIELKEGGQSPTKYFLVLNNKG